jgi:hypothetical protein
LTLGNPGNGIPPARSAAICLLPVRLGPGQARVEVSGGTLFSRLPAFWCGSFTACGLAGHRWWGVAEEGSTRLDVALPALAKSVGRHEFRTFTGLTPTRYVDVRRRFLREHPGHALDVGPLPAD